MKISTKKLLLVAGLIWAAAGLNILNLGIISYGADWSAIIGWLLAGTIAVFLVFYIFIFGNMVKKHEKRIRSIADEKSSIFKFLDVKGYVIMAIMMGGGISLRFFHLVPEWFIAFFYTGLGAALVLSGVLFVARYFRIPQPSQQSA